MNKLEEVKALLKSPDSGGRSNVEIADLVGCDEGLVRKARPLVRVELLEEENARLKEELGRYRRVVRPKRHKYDHSRPLPLWERLLEDGSIIPVVPILEVPS